MFGDCISPNGSLQLILKGTSEYRKNLTWAFGVAFANLVIRKRRGIYWQSIQERQFPDGPDFEGRDVQNNYIVWEAKGTTAASPNQQLTKARQQLENPNVPNGARKYALVLHAPQNQVAKMVVADPPLSSSSPDWIEAAMAHFGRLARWSGFELVNGKLFAESDQVKIREEVNAHGTEYITPFGTVFLGLSAEVMAKITAGDWESLATHNREDSLEEVGSLRSLASHHGDGFVLIHTDCLHEGSPTIIGDPEVVNPSHDSPGSSGVCRGGDSGSGGVVMSDVGKPERATQNRVIALFRDELKYRYLGDWTYEGGNSNIDEELLMAYLTKSGYTPAEVKRAVYKLFTEANNKSRSLYANNQAVYSLLRYGVSVKTEAGKDTETVHLINWDSPEQNDFAIAEEVTLDGDHERRPDIVLYVNGIAVGVLELKNSRVSIGDGIRQSLSNQRPEFHEWFFSTVQFIFAGNDSEGLQYGTTGTPEKYFLKWKEDEGDNSRFKLDKYLLKMCRKDRLIELMHDFVLFDGGVKKVPRVHQYFGIKAAQAHVKRRQGGIIWHTQGSGKSIIMVLLARWILENNPNARVAIITDRDELDKQIRDVFTAAGETIYRTSSGRDLMSQLGQAKPRLLCSLIHKFGRRDVADFDAFIKDLKAQPTQTVGEVWVFVDECHRTQSGKLHKVMSAMLPNATFIGFTGTPLLKKDKQTTLEVFGGYIHTYKFNEAVDDEVVLDLVYEARDIDQRLGSQAKIDAWFEAKTRGLNDWQKDELKKQWGTMQKVLSSRSRMERVVNDIVFDFSVKPRLSSERGNAILVTSSIYEACKYFTLFQKTPLKGKCAVVTSYNPQTQDVTKEETGANTETEKQFIYSTYTELLKAVVAQPAKTKTETYEDTVKAQFIKEPASMKLLIVVDKLLTGFDAPPCTYLYIDKSMQDHGLFQAICRTNRLDGEDKDFGYIVDYKDLFKKVENAIAVYTSELDRSAGGADPEVFLQDRLKKGREQLDNALEALALLCEPVEPPKGELEHMHYFCGNTEIPSDLQDREPQRAALYKATATLVRAYANIADELEAAGYESADIARIKRQLEHYLDVREILRRASGETLDLKAYEADMRHLIDTYIEADEPRKISPFDNIGLIELIVKTGIADAIASQLGGLKGNKDAIAETIENNVRSRIIKEHLSDPAYYEKMSALLDEIIALRKAKAIEYEEYLQRIADLVKNMEAGQATDTLERLDTPGKRALYHNLNQNEALALRVHEAVKTNRPDGWRGHQAKENTIKAALLPLLGNDGAEVERVFLIIQAQKEY
jgi:type I restriction enzyme, R subunit